MARQRQTGFTLLELVLVITLLAIVAAFAIPSFDSATTGETLHESARRIRALVGMCRAEAMSGTCRHRVLIRQDGSLRVRRQADPLKAPHLYITPRAAWARGPFLQADVWIEAVQLLPEGPPPIRIIDERLVFPETEIDATPVQELERPVEIEFEPDGTCNSLRFVLRHRGGQGLLVTLDGRVGRVTLAGWPAAAPDDLERPDPLPPDADAEDEYRPEDFE